MRYWLMKSEPHEFSIDDLDAAPGRATAWSGVRNYQARNFIRDRMRAGDRAFFYHSDGAANREAPRWYSVEVRLLKKTPLVSLARLRGERALGGMRVLARGNRLSITPVEAREWNVIVDKLMVRK
ncbi:MAG: EVE domain-containing protein [Betaproteobacteria bacterium]|nr:EVE domain-containing protein [Betaproteobacteria bacterium]